MNTNDIREHLLSRAPWVDRTRTVDTVKAGDPIAHLETDDLDRALASADLHPVESAPRITLPVYAAYPAWSRQEALIGAVLEIVQGFLGPARGR